MFGYERLINKQIFRNTHTRTHARMHAHTHTHTHTDTHIHTPLPLGESKPFYITVRLNKIWFISLFTWGIWLGYKKKKYLWLVRSYSLPSLLVLVNLKQTEGYPVRKSDTFHIERFDTRPLSQTIHLRKRELKESWKILDNLLHLKQLSKWAPCLLVVT